MLRSSEINGNINMKDTSGMTAFPVRKTANDDSLLATNEPAFEPWPFFADDEIVAALARGSNAAVSR